jgi:hypothetical protein
MEQDIDTQPVVVLETISNEEVKRCTGFCSVILLLCYIAIVCNGNVADMMEKQSPLCWFEEWFLYFEWVWEKSLTRWTDAQSKYGLSPMLLREIVNSKQTKV